MGDHLGGGTISLYITLGYFYPISKGVIAEIRYAKDSFGCFKQMEREYFKFSAVSEMKRREKSGH